MKSVEVLEDLVQIKDSKINEKCKPAQKDDITQSKVHLFIQE
jgi:hypothetical protein